MPFTPDQLYDLVADVTKYPQFLPWCVGARIRQKRENMMIADLIIGYKMIREQFTSKVTFYPEAKKLDVEYTEGPFKYLNNHWVFNEVEGGTEIDFFIDFEFRSALFQKMIGPLFNEAVKIMVSSFEKRATELYGLKG